MKTYPTLSNNNKAGLNGSTSLHLSNERSKVLTSPHNGINKGMSQNPSLSSLSLEVAAQSKELAARA
jgi:hypothetical protein